VAGVTVEALHGVVNNDSEEFVQRGFLPRLVAVNCGQELNLLLIR